MPEARLRLRDNYGNRAVVNPIDPDYTIISAYARGASPWNELAPQLPNPFSFEDEDGVTHSALIFENMWQAMTVYRRVVPQNDSRTGWVWPDEIHVDYATLKPNEKWRKWSEALTNHTKVVSRPNGTQIPLYVWFKGQQLGFAEARRKVYVPFLQRMYRQNRVYHCMLARFMKGDNIVIIAPHGPCQTDYPQGKDMTYEDLLAAQEVPDVPFGPRTLSFYGHGHVIAQTLFEDRAAYANVLAYPPSPPPSNKRPRPTPFEDEDEELDWLPLGI